MAYSRWQLKFRPDEPVALEWIDWHLEREVRDPFPIEYCAARAAVASERRFR
jgi:hypothetical protein